MEQFNLPEIDESYISAYHYFLKERNSVCYLPQLPEELELVEQYLKQNNVNDSDDGIQTEKEEWMILLQLNPDFHGTQNALDNIKGRAAITNITPDQTQASLNWIATIRKEHTVQTVTVTVDQDHMPKIDPLTLNEEQKLAYKIVTNHHSSKTHAK